LRFISKISVADYATLGNGLCGVSAIVLFLIASSPNWGVSFILFGMVLDGIDGTLARKYGSKHSYGRHLDSIADSITFCAAPAVMVLVVFGQPKGEFLSNLTSLNLFTVVCGSLIFILGISRLVTFTKEGYKLTNFSGLATPAMTFLVVMVASAYHYRFTSVGAAYGALALLSIASLLMISNLEYPKIKGSTGFIFALGLCIGISVILILKFTFLPSTIYNIRVIEVMLFTALVAIAGYVLFSPFYLMASRRREKGGLGKAV